MGRKEKRNIRDYRLDNAGKLYPSLINHRQTTLFRLTAGLDHRIKIGDLQLALEQTIERYPYFKVRLGSGFFWYYFTNNEHPVILEQDSRFPCMKMIIKKRAAFPFRIRAYADRISLEFSHMLSDGNGALRFFKTLLAHYFLLGGYDCPELEAETCLPDESVLNTEWEDSFRRYYKAKIPPPQKQEPAWILRNSNFLPKHEYNVITGTIPLEPVKQLAAQKKVSITELIGAFHLAALQDCFEASTPEKKRHKSRPIRLSLPVNLRKMFPSETMRNFFLSVEPSIDPRLGHYSFDEILQKTHHFLKYELDRKFLNQQISRNVKGESRLFTRLIPLSLKNMIIPSLYRIKGERNYTSGLSNLGIIDFPESINRHVNSFEFIPPPGIGTRKKAGMITYGDKLYVSFGSLIRERNLERYFFSRIRKAGIPVRIHTNDLREGVS